MLEHTTNIQGDSLHPLPDSDHKRGTSRQDHGLQICRGSTKETLDILEEIRVLFLAMIPTDFQNVSLQDPLLFFRTRSLNCFRIILRRILNDLGDISEVEIARILIRILAEPYRISPEMIRNDTREATSAYLACATQFRPCTFLVGEAIKDMLAALQAFQLSTYIVQNDRIAYVEGEATAENNVRGYDTVWAYYYENQMHSISDVSLETSVPIIIN